jgi:transglutaminase-like putative cysteine protease
MTGTNVRCYRVEYQTAYRYEEPVTLSHHQLRLTRRPLAHQHSQAHELALTPAPAYRCERTDAFGNPVTELAIESAHSALEIVARSTVAVSQREVPPAETTAPWEDAREVLAYPCWWATRSRGSRSHAVSFRIAPRAGETRSAGLRQRLL